MRGGRSINGVAHGVNRLADRFSDHRHDLNDITGDTEWQGDEAAAAQEKQAEKAPCKAHVGVFLLPLVRKRISSRREPCAACSPPSRPAPTGSGVLRGVG